MSKKGYKQTVEHKKRIGLANSVSQKGKKLSKKTKRKIGLNGFHYGMRGKKHSIETKMKMRKANKGEKSYLWKGGISPLNTLIRACFKYRQWRSDVFTRDDFT